jgi:prepilin-type N-terminal cleavage/methylation domain-containing protein
MMRARPAGFTLIELMISVAIVGILSSVAIPSFRALQLRARQAERRTVMRSIHTALDDLWLREGRFPDGTAASNSLTGGWNPAWPPRTQRRPFQTNAAGWNRLTVNIEGGVFYSYYAYASVNGATRYYLIYTYGDLDGDSQYNIVYDQFQFTGASLDWQNTYDNAVSVGEVF